MGKPQGPITIAAHSLGNVVVSNAIARGNLKVDRYYMIDAAAPIEAYDSSQVHGRDGSTVMADNMTEATWKDYPKELYAANWSTLFPADDNRNRLTWRGRFAEVVSKAYNFYSPGEDVVENAIDGETVLENILERIGDAMNGQGLGRHTWVMQEIAKGCSDLLARALLENCTAGWNYNDREKDWPFIGDSIGDSFERYNATEAQAARDSGELTNEELAQFGFFRKFGHYAAKESGYADLYAPITPDGEKLGYITSAAGKASRLAGEDETQWDLLASGIPALSFGAGANPIKAIDETDSGGLNRNFDMEALRIDANGWPQERLKGAWKKRWLHSDIRNMALPYVFKTYDKMLELGGFLEW